MRSSHFVIGFLVLLNLVSLAGSRLVSYHIQQKYVGKINEPPVEQIYSLVKKLTTEYSPVKVWNLPDLGLEKLSSELIAAVTLFPSPEVSLLDELDRIELHWKKEGEAGSIKDISTCLSPQQKESTSYAKYSMLKCLEHFPLKDWIEKFASIPPAMSPLGGSYIWRIWSQQPQSFQDFNVELKKKLIQVTHFYERYQMPWSIDLLPENIVRYLGVSDYQQMLQVNPLLIGHDRVFILQYGPERNTYLEYTAEQWRRHQDEYPQVAASFSDAGMCGLKLYDFCWVQNKEFYSRFENLVQMRDVWPLAIALFSLILFLIYFLALRIRIESHQRLMIGALTHEVRHPIFSIQLSADLLRKEIDYLSSSGQEELMRILDQLLKMKKVLKASQVYLKSFFSSGEEFTFKDEEIPSVNDFLMNLVEEIFVEYEVEVEFHEMAEDCRIYADSYWLGMCLSNLLSNAVKYGRTGVLLKAEVKGKRIQFVVQDQGEKLNHLKNLKDVLALSTGNTRSFEAGMGLGLSLIARIIQRMGGRFYFKPLPTRFIVELECVYEKEHSAP